MKIGRIKKKNIFYLLLVFIIFDYYIQITLGYLGNRLPYRIPNFGYIAFYVIIFFMVLLLGSYLIPKEKKRCTAAICIFCFLFIYYLFAMIFSPKSLDIDISGFSLLKLMTYYFIIVVAFVNVIDYDLLLRWLVVATRILSPVIFLMFYVDYVRSGYTYSNYDMVLGYRAALFAIILINSLIAMKRFKPINIIDIVELLVMIMISLFVGSRGSILTILVYVLAIVFKQFVFGRNIYAKIAYIFLSVLVAYLFMKHSADLLVNVSSILKKININSRTIDMLAAKDILNSTNRDIKIEACINSWEKMPLLGYGLLGDRQFLNGTYVHNYLLETITDFGFIFGPIIISYVLLGVIKGFRDGSVYSFVLILSSYEMTHLMISGTYLTSTLYFVLLGILLSLSFNIKSVDHSY